MSNEPQNWGPGPGPQGPGQQPQGQQPQGQQPQGPAYGQQPMPGQQPGPHGQQPMHPQGPGAYGQQGPAYGGQAYVGPGQPGAYGQQGPQGPGAGAPPKKSRLPMIIGIVAVAALVLVGGGILLFSTLFKAPTLAADRMLVVLDRPGVQVGSVALERGKASKVSFGTSDDCSKKLTAATEGSDTFVTADKPDATILLGHTADAAATDKAYSALADTLKDCQSSTLSTKEKGVNAGVANGVSYKVYTVSQPRSTTKELDLVLMKYGNTYAVALAKPGVISEPKQVAQSYGARVQAAAK